MSAELITKADAVEIRQREVLLSPVMNLQTAVNRLNQFQEFVAGYLHESKDGGQDGGDFGAIPGAGKKKVLLKSGADKLCELYGLYDEYEVKSSENFETNLFFYTVKCILRSRRDDSVVGTGVGSCSTFESKYRWRDSQRKCPKCQAEAIIKGREEYGGGWLCFGKKGGCGAKFKDDDAVIVGQKIGRVENPDILDTVNTVLKMAKKRAKIDAVIGATRSSGIFSQDLEEIIVTPEKTVAVTAEDIPVSGPASSSDATATRKGQAPSKSTEEAGAVTSAPADSKYINIGQQKNIHMEFRKAIRKDYSADKDFVFYDLLAQDGFVDEQKVPTAARIPADRWFEVKERYLKKAASL